MMKIRYFLLSLLMLVSATTFAAKTSRADSIKILNDKINEYQSSIDRINSIVQTSNGSIANSIAGSQHYLTGFTVVFSILGIGIGLFVNSIYNKIQLSEAVNEKILIDTRNSRDESAAIQRNVQALSNNINENLQDVFLKLQNVEIKFILDRLIEAPEEFSLYWDKLNTHYKMSPEMLPAFITMVKNLPQATQGFALNLLFKYFKNEDLLKDLEIAAILAANPLDTLHGTDNKKFEIIESLSQLYKSGNFNPVYEDIIKKSLGNKFDINHPNAVQAAIIKHFGGEYVGKLVAR